MFFERRTQSSIKHRRLKYLLLFALRCAFIALLVLAFARPYIHSSAIANATGGRTMVFAIDNSFSMRQGDRFTKAKEEARAEIHKMHEGDRGQIVTFGGPARLITDLTTDQQALLGALAAIEPGDDASSYAELSRVLRSTSRKSRSPISKPHIFTDDSEILPARGFSDLQLDDGTKLVVHSVADKAVPNWTVENVDAPRRVFDTKKVRTVATIAGFNTDDATRKVTLVANGKPVETKDVKVPAERPRHGGVPDARRPLWADEMRSPHRPRGRISRRTTIGCSRWSAPIRSLRCWCMEITIRRPPARSICAPRSNPPPTRRSRWTRMTPIQATNANLSKYAFVILSDAGPLPAKLEEELESYVQAGGSMLVSLGRNATPGRQVAGGRHPGQRHPHHRDRQRNRCRRVAQIDTSYPAVRPRAELGFSVEIFQYATLQTPPDSPDARIAATSGERFAAAGRPQSGRRARADFRFGLQQHRQQFAAAAGLAAVPRKHHASRWAESARRAGIIKSDPTWICARSRKRISR